MNLAPQASAQFVHQLREVASTDEQQQMVLFPTALSASEVARAVQGSRLRWGGQNCFHEASGAFTGETSPNMLKDLGAQYCLVGHSERRHIFAEPDEMIAKKVQYLQSIGMTPLLCVGETIDDRRWNRTKEVIIRQLKTAIQGADPNAPLWIAYEPVWAIGTGEVATPPQVEEAHGMLRQFLNEWSLAASANTPILYGGSVKPENAKSLAGLNHVDGFLIGGASLKVQDFIAILRASV